MDSEIDVSGATDRPSCSTLVPRTEPGGRLTLHRRDGTSLRRHRFGFLEPGPDSEPVPIDDVDVVLVPGLAFDRLGFRIGHGAGMYDRLLDELPVGVVRVGVAVDACVVDRLPREAHDLPLDWIATESGIRRCGAELTATSERVVAAALERGIAAAMVRYPDGTKTSRDAADAVGAELGSIAKSLVFLVDDRPVLVLCSGDRRIDPRRLAGQFDAETARPAPLERVREVTGFVAGGTPAVGHRTPLPVLADVSLARYRWVWSAGGTPDTVYPIALDRLIAATGARWADVAAGG
jgi:prolyl-tRNA editing enzyme YbaK/EbsC (Cys-tRNA(Pro) deacylase)